MLIAPFSAIPSWEGFEYQRHIALYMSLKRIWSEVESENEESINLYTLGMEGEEDFSIIRDNRYLSLHQVKAGAVNLEPSDKSCFIISKLQYNATEAYFHLNPNVVIASDFVSKTIETIDQLLSDLNKEVKTEEEFLDKKRELERSEEKSIDKKDALYKQLESEYIVISNITYNKPKGSHYKILDYVCSGNKEKANVVNVVSDVVAELEHYKEVLTGKSDSDLWQVYGEKYETSSDVISKSCGIIEQILMKIHSDGEIYYDDDYYQFIYDKIVVHSQNVIRQHDTKYKKNACKISLQEFFDLIKKDHKADSNSIDYMYYELFNLIKQTFENYPTSRNNICDYDSCSECETNDECNLFQQMIEISNKSYIDKKDFLHKLLARTPRNNLPRDTVVNNAFITLLRKINSLKYVDTNIILAEKKGEIYRLTLDENEDIEDFHDQLVDELSVSSNFLSLFFENDVLITDRLKKDKYAYNLNNFNILNDKELEELVGITSDSIEQRKANYNKSKIIRIIDKTKAQGELVDNEQFDS